MTTRNYTNSELFKLANQIRRSTGCTKSEAYHKAKAQLEAPKTTKGRKQKYSSIVVTSKISPLVRSRYNFTVGESFSSVKEVAERMHSTVQNVYAYIYGGLFKIV